MSTRILLAGILGGIVMFIWNFIAHDLLPLGYMGVKTMSNEDAVRSALDTNLGDSPGFYIFPSGGWTPGMNADQKKEVMKKVAEQTAQGAAGIMIYRPKRQFNFPRRLIIEIATDVAEALL